MSAELVTEALKAFCPGGTGEKLVLVILANHTNSQTGLCFPSIPTIARQAGFSTDNAVYRHLRSLEYLGHITRISGGGRKSGGKAGNSNRYRVHPRRVLEDASVGESSQLPEAEENNPLRSERVNSDTLSLEALNPLTQDVLTLSPERGEQEGTGNRTGKGRKAGSGLSGLSKSTTEELPFSSDAFVEAWEEWKQHRREKRKAITPTAQSRQFNTFTEWGEVRSIAAIHHSIEKGWTGVYEPKSNQPHTAAKKPLLSLKL
jgi:hypothetical protein